MSTPSNHLAIPDRRLPRYLQIRDELMRRICARALTAGEALPSEDKLAVEFNVSTGTLRKALEVLVADGIVERVHGRGTFVTRAFERISMLRFLRMSDSEAGALPQTSVVDLRIVRDPADIQARLCLPRDEKMLYLHRTRSFGDEAVLSEHVWLSQRKFAKLEVHLRTVSPPLLYPVYDSLCGVLVSRAMDELTVVPLPEADAAVFKVRPKTLAVRVERAMSDHAGQPVEWRVSYVQTHRFRYVTEPR